MVTKSGASVSQPFCLKNTACFRPFTSGLWDALRDVAPVADILEPEMRRGVMGAMGALAYGALEPVQRPFPLEVPRQMPVGAELFDVLRQEGERQGEVRKAREAVLDAFLTRLDRVPAPVE